MNDEKISVKDLRAHSEVLIELGSMPPLEEVLAVIADTRKKYQPKIAAARRERKKKMKKRLDNER